LSEYKKYSKNLLLFNTQNEAHLYIHSYSACRLCLTWHYKEKAIYADGISQLRIGWLRVFIDCPPCFGGQGQAESVSRFFFFCCRFYTWRALWTGHWIFTNA